MLFDEIRKREIPLILDECCFFIILILSCFKILEIKYNICNIIPGRRELFLILGRKEKRVY